MVKYSGSFLHARNILYSDQLYGSTLVHLITDARIILPCFLYHVFIQRVYDHPSKCAAVQSLRQTSWIYYYYLVHLNRYWIEDGGQDQNIRLRFHRKMFHLVQVERAVFTRRVQRVKGLLAPKSPEHRSQHHAGSISRLLE